MVQLLETLPTWVGAILSVYLWSLIWKENRLFRIAEYVLVGAAAGNLFVMGFGYINAKAVLVSKGAIVNLIPILLGVLLFASFSKGYYWLSRYSVALMIGAGTGLTVRLTGKAQVLDQIVPTLTIMAKEPFDIFNNILVFIAVFTSISYFVFTREQTGFLGVSAKVGRYAMYIAFGASYGGTVMTRLGNFIPQVQTMLLPENILITGLATLSVAALIAYRFIKEK